MAADDPAPPDGADGPADEDEIAPEDEEDEENESGAALIADELVEVFRCSDELLAQIAIDEVLGPEGIPALVHNRVSHAFPAPASLPGAYFVAVPVDRAREAVDALREAQGEGLLPLEGEVAELP
jgi:hypothetical protein